MGEPVLNRAFRLLDAFSADEPALTLTRLAQKAEIPLSTALRLAQKLVRLRALERRSDGAFVVGIRMLEFAALAPRGHGLRAIALPYMEDLHRAAGQHVQLAVREGDAGVIVERLSAPQAGKVCTTRAAASRSTAPDWAWCCWHTRAPNSRTRISRGICGSNPRTRR